MSSSDKLREQFIRDVLRPGQNSMIPSSWSFLYHNNKLRRILKAIFTGRTDLSYRKLEKLIKYDKSNIHAYLNLDLIERKDQKLPDLKIIELAKVLGVTIDVDIELDEDFSLKDHEQSRNDE